MTALGIPFEEIVRERVSRSPGFAANLLAEAVNCAVTGETNVAAMLLEHVLIGTTGSATLPRDAPVSKGQLKALVEGAGSSEDLLALIRWLQARLDVQLEISARPRDKAA